MQILRTVSELRQCVGGWRAEGLRVGLVPTMGGLHDGHLSLVRQVAKCTDRVIATLFVNPTQFAPHEDFEAYPRNEDADRRKFAEAGAALMFAPPAAEMYPPGHATRVSVEGLGDVLEGEFRPHFFDGVATIVTKLLLQALPDAAIFGEKDYQQLCVIRALARDLDIPVEILGGPTVRETDGLAMSSRNAYLSAAERTVAPSLHENLLRVARAARAGEDCAAACRTAQDRLIAAGFAKVDYITVRDAETLAPVSPVTAPARVLAAAWFGRTRLIDNVPVAGE